jgi:hypothetical protein
MFANSFQFVAIREISVKGFCVAQRIAFIPVSVLSGLVVKGNRRFLRPLTQRRWRGEDRRSHEGRLSRLQLPGVGDFPLADRANLRSFNRYHGGRFPFQSRELHFVGASVAIYMHHRSHVAGFQPFVRNTCFQHHSLMLFDHTRFLPQPNIPLTKSGWYSLRSVRAFAAHNSAGSRLIFCRPFRAWKVYGRNDPRRLHACRLISDRRFQMAEGADRCHVLTIQRFNDSTITTSPPPVPVRAVRQPRPGSCHRCSRICGGGGDASS